jgi:hypothetical protein
VSEHYADKVWTNHERKSAQARALHENQEYILPVRFDNTEIPGLRSTVAYIDARSSTKDELVNLILEKLREPLPEPAPEAGPMRVPRTAEQQRQLLAQQPPLWEYLLFASVLAQGKAALEAKWLDYQVRYVRPVGPPLDNVQAVAFIQHAMSDIKGVPPNVERVLDPQVQERAFGAPGFPGDPIQIEYMSQRIIEIYETFLDWAARIRGAVVPEEFGRLFELVALLVDEPVNQIRAFIDKTVAEVDRIPDLLASPDDTPITITLSLILSIDDRKAVELDREMDYLARKGLFG